MNAGRSGNLDHDEHVHCPATPVAGVELTRPKQCPTIGHRPYGCRDVVELRPVSNRALTTPGLACSDVASQHPATRTVPRTWTDLARRRRARGMRV